MHIALIVFGVVFLWFGGLFITMTWENARFGFDSDSVEDLTAASILFFIWPFVLSINITVFVYAGIANLLASKFRK